MGKASRRKKMNKEARAAGFLTTNRGRTIPLDEETLGLLEKSKEAFVKKFGREPGPDDPVFFDPDAQTPQPLSEERVTKDVLEAMAKAGIPGDIMFAYRKTGLIATEQNLAKMLPEDRKAWYDAIDEYKQLVSEGKLQ